MLQQLKEIPDLWEHLSKTDRPIFLYGMGNGADKVLTELERRKLSVRGVFANDEFVRGQTYRGLTVQTYDSVREQYGNVTVLLSYGTHRPEVIDRICRIAEEQELLVPDVPVAGGEAFSRDFLITHYTEFERIYELLADEASRELYESVLFAKLTGQLKSLLMHTSDETENWNLLGLQPGEHYVDLGAYIGDTIELFLKKCPEYATITAFEPDARNFRKLTENTSGLSNLSLHCLAASDSTTESFFMQGSGRGCGRNGKGKPVRLDSVDHVLAGKPATYIKLDVEGMEADAIRGAAQTIQQFHPKLLLSAYHRTEDLYALPLQLLRLEKNYRIYLRRSRCLPAWELNYYCVPKEAEKYAAD